MAQITPKALTALQKLLAVNTPNHQGVDNETNSRSQNNMNFSGSQQMKEKKKMHSPIVHPSTFDPCQRSSLSKQSNSDYKNELIHVLKKSTYSQSKNKKLKKQGNSLKQLLQPQFQMFGKHLSAPNAKKEAQLSERESYKKKRPPQLRDIDEDQDSQCIHPVQSAKNASQPKRSPLNFENKYNSGFFTSTNSRSNGVFGSLNEVLRKYIQAKSQQKQAGTGEGVKIPVCKSARNCDKQQNLEKQAYMSAQKSKQQHSPEHAQVLSDLYLKTSKILNAYRSKEKIWKQQKKSLRDEVKFLKLLLQHQEDLNFQSNI